MSDTDTRPDPQVDQRLREEQIVWLATVRPNGQPQAVPVWFLWDGQTFLIYSRPEQQKLRNIGSNPRVALHLNSDERGGGIVRMEGIAEVLRAPTPASEVGEYVEKYRAGMARIGFSPDVFAREYSVAIRVTPVRWRG